MNDRPNLLLILGGWAGCPRFFCKEVKRRRRICKAKIINVAGTILVPGWGQYWECANSRKHWRLRHSLGRGPGWARIGRIPSDDLIWARSLTGHSLERYEIRPDGKLVISHWVVVREIRTCDLCGEEVSFEAQNKKGRPVRLPYYVHCRRCEEKLTRIFLKNDAWHVKHQKKYDDERARRNAIARWTREYSAGGHFSRREFAELCERFGGVCLACGTKSELVADHVIPLSKGGGNKIDNIQPLCASCNLGKGSLLKDYRRSVPAS